MQLYAQQQQQLQWNSPALYSMLKCTCSEWYSEIRKSSPKETCTTRGQSRHLACIYLWRRERESISVGYREWCCWGTFQSPLSSTMPSRNHPSSRQMPNSTMLQELPIIHTKTLEDAITTRIIPRKKSDEANRMHKWAPCSGNTARIRLRARRFAFLTCYAQYHIASMMSNMTQIVRIQRKQRWQCDHCSQKPVADSEDNPKKSMVYTNTNFVIFNGTPTASI